MSTGARKPSVGSKEDGQSSGASEVTRLEALLAEALAERDSLKHVIDAQSDTFFLFEPNTGRALRWNRAFRDISGYTDEEIARLPAPATYYSPEDLVQAETCIQKVLREGACTIEMELICKDGRKIPTEYRASAIMGERGQPFCLIVIGRDITEREAEAAVRKERRRAQAYLDVANTMLVALDVHGIVTLINRKGCEILGYPHGEIIGKKWFSNFLPKEHRAEVRAVFAKLMSGETDIVAYYENSVVTSSGEERILGWQNTFVRDDAGGIAGTLSSANDITERKRLEQSLANVTEEERERLWRDLHDGIAQELTGLRFLSASLRRKLLATQPEAAENAAQIEQIAGLTLKSVRQVANGLEPLPEEPNALVAALEQLASRVSDMHGIQCDFTSGEPVLIQNPTAATHLYLIAQEAVSNAVKHAKASRIAISLSERNGRVILTVRDDGVGFSRRKKSEGMGLHIMLSRATCIRASFCVKNGETGGTIVTCSWKETPKG